MADFDNGLSILNGLTVNGAVISPATVGRTPSQLTTDGYAKTTNITKVQAGLGNVDNTNDLEKPINDNLVKYVRKEKEYFTGLDFSSHVGTVNATCIDLPNTHSDNGEWIDKCYDKSWYTEPLGGNFWLNVRCNAEAVARSTVKSLDSPNIITTKVNLWNAGSSATITNIGEMISVKQNILSYGQAHRAFTLIVGKTYSFTGKVSSLTSIPCIVNIGSTNATVVTGFFSIIYTAVSANITIAIAHNNTNPIDSVLVFSDLFLREIDTTVSADNYVYQNSTDGKFYKLTGESGQIEVFRGIKKEYPKAGVLWTAEATRIIGYDLGTGAMWMVFIPGGGWVSWNNNTLNVLDNTFGMVNICAYNGMLIASSSLGVSQKGAVVIEFIVDTAHLVGSGENHRTYSGNLANRNLGMGYTTKNTRYPSIPSNRVNDVDIKILSTAPIDIITGLPKPTIVIATSLGLAVIRDTGVCVVLSSDNVSYNHVRYCRFLPNGRLMFGLCFDNLAGALTDDNRIHEVDVPLVSVSNYAFNALIPSLNGMYISSRTILETVNWPGAIGPSKSIEDVFATNTGVIIFKKYNNSINSSLVAVITKTYNSGWMPGGIRGMWLSDIVSETITGTSNLITNSTFDTNTTGWTGYLGTLTASEGTALVTIDGSQSYGFSSTSITTVVGLFYRVTADYIKGTGSSANLRAGTSPGSDALAIFTRNTSGKLELSFKAVGTTTFISLVYNGTINQTHYFDNVSVFREEPDRSIKNFGLVLRGTLTKNAVATGSSIVSYSGFSSVNYLEQSYNPSLDFGIGDLFICLWARSIENNASTQSYIDLFGSNNRGFRIGRVTSGGASYPNTPLVTVVGSTGSYSTTGGDPNLSAIKQLWCFLAIKKTSTGITIYQNDVLMSTTLVDIGDVSTVDGVLKIGTGFDVTSNESQLAMIRISATVPTDEQISQIYKDELQLFQPNAKCVIDGTATAVTAIAKDETSGLLHIGTSVALSSFKNLLRVSSEPSTVGSISSIAANNGTVAISGTGTKLTTKTVFLKDETVKNFSSLTKKQNFLPFDFTAVTSQTVFPVPKGFTIKKLFKNGLSIRESTTGTFWKRSFDGYQEYATLSTACVAGDWISLTCVINS